MVVVKKCIKLLGRDSNPNCPIYTGCLKVSVRRKNNVAVVPKSRMRADRG